MKYLMKPGRCANGAQRDSGTLVHAVPTEQDWGDFTPALCKAVPGRRTPGWVESHIEVSAPTCPRCLRKLEQLAQA